MLFKDTSIKMNHVMRKIIDSNYLQDKRLKLFLSSNPQNYAVIIDYATMEAYKENTLKSIYNSMKILSQFPTQVIVLKGTNEICGLKSTKKGLEKRLIDTTQTKQFRNFCNRLELAEKGNFFVKKQLLNHGKAADNQMHRILTDTGKVIEAIQLIENFTKEELKIIRENKSLSNEIIDKIIKDSLTLAVILFSNHPKVFQIPRFNELSHLYIFRYALAAYLLMLDWKSKGGVNNVQKKKMRNDIIDMHFVAYATFFDGLLTNDKKTNNIYEKVLFILSFFNTCNKYWEEQELVTNINRDEYSM